MFGIPKRVTSLCLWAFSETFSLFLGGDVSDDSGHDGIPADLCRLRVSSRAILSPSQRLLSVNNSE